MIIPPKYQLTPETIQLVSKIDSLKLFFKSLSLADSLKLRLNRQSLLKSSLFSAKIEGNPLSLNELENPTKNSHKKEVFNILKAYQYINKKIGNDSKITKKDLKRIHFITIKDLSPEAGYFRREMSAIFNQAGIAIYVPPSPQDVSHLLNKLTKFIEKENNFPLITALIAHLVFEKIHPFLDGNGRVGRLLIFAVLKTNNYQFDIFPAFEEELERNRADYYYYLDNGLKETEEYLEFMLGIFYKSCLNLKKQIELNLQRGSQRETLFPRQEEILNIIGDHKIISFDFIRRRFMRINPRTLRRDLKILKDKNLIIKIGKTKGVLYKAKN